ncbi:MAG: hypothetical protein OHK0032_15550 [Thermodesulfovibrionales bacterium]
MLVKRLLVLLVAVIFTLGVVSLAFSAEAITGKLLKIEDKKLTIKTKDKEVTVEVKEIKGPLKVGDNVIVKDGIAKKKKAIEGC